MLKHNNIPGVGSMTDTIEFMRKMWGGMGAPTMGMPSLSVEEINKKITDLKTVASWLDLNMNMLRATIQTLEVQSATLSTLQTMGNILTAQEAPGQGRDASPAKSGATASSGFSGWPMPEAPEQSQKTPEPRAKTMAHPENQDEEHQATADAPVHARPEAVSSHPDFQAAMSNPNAWWNLLQTQFQQAVGQVLADQGTAVKAAQAVTQSAVAPDQASQTGASKKTTKSKTVVKPRPRAKSTVVQSAPSKSVYRKPKSS